MEKENVSPSMKDFYKNTKRRADGDLMYQAKRRRDVRWTKASVKHRHKFERLVEVCKDDPQSIRMISGHLVCFEEVFLIGRGSYGTAVYICLGLDGIERAVKCVPKHLRSKLLKNERDMLTSQNAVDSPQVVNYHFFDDFSSPEFDYLILDLHEQNLEEFIKKEGEMITESCVRKMFRQLLEGLKALHAREPRILHRDLKPTNILVDKNGDLVLSDFGNGRFFQKQGATTYNTSNESGSHGWVAYECIDWDRLQSDEVHNPSDAPLQLKWKEQSDILAAGMVGFYILTKGKHPFGPKIDQLTNLRDDNPMGLSKLSDPVVKDLLSQMLAREIGQRPYVEQALKHPYFLSPEEQVKFLEAVGNEPEIKNSKKYPKKDDPCAVSRELDNLDPSKLPLLPNDWTSVIEPDNFKTFCEGGYTKPSRYDGSRYTQCLRLIRNVRQHWGDIQPRPPLKAMGLATSIEEYFLQLWPRLPLVCHQIIRKYPGWTTRPSLKEFFPVINRCTVSDAD